MSFIHGHTYRLFSVAYPTLALNVYGTNAASTGRNVCLYDKDENPNDIMQKWYVTKFSENDDYGFVMRSKVDNSFVLDRSDGSVSSSYNNNAHLCKETYTTALDCRVEPINVQGNIYRICLPGRNLYLTAANGNGTNPTSSITTQSQLTGANKNVYWAAEATTVGSTAYNKQCWTVVDLDAEEEEGGGTETGNDIKIPSSKYNYICQQTYPWVNNAYNITRDNFQDTGCAAVAATMFMQIMDNDPSIVPEDLFEWGVIENSGGYPYASWDTSGAPVDYTFYKAASAWNTTAKTNICNEITSGRPVIIHLKDDEGGTHFVVGYGLKAGTTASNITYNKIYVLDPWTPDNKTLQDTMNYTTLWSKFGNVRIAQ